ncbi:MAG: response regulator [Myxococcota bacterium]|nr:response regulator [Myxococcota bacterium]
MQAVVIDDDEDTCAMLAALLARAGFGVRTFASAAGALSAIRDARPDVVVTDLHLPEGSGAELAQALRADPATAHVAIVALTGQVDPDWEIVRHFDAYLRKPFEPERLPSLLVALAAAAAASRDRVA